jgi:cyclopropane-fatty-acyl-phospholipid synthase
VFQIQCARRSDTVPLTRAYIAERYEDLRMRETEARTAAAASSPFSDPVPIRKQRQ